MSTKTAHRASFGVTLLVRDSGLCLHTQRAARALSRRLDEALRPTGLKSGQFSLLISMDRTTLTANLKPLRRHRLLTVTPDAKDRPVCLMAP